MHRATPTAPPELALAFDPAEAPHWQVSAIVPARNEAPCIAAVVHALRALRQADGTPLLLEVVVADNGSNDGTGTIAAQAGALVIQVPQPGYGQACWTAVQACRGNALLFVDGDGAADASDAQALLTTLTQGADLVIGVRTKLDPGAMTPPQRVGNALACLLMRQIWRMPASDLGPYRAIRRHAFERLDMRDRSFGWTVEMQVRAHALQMAVQEVPVAWRARSGGVSKISGTWRGVLGAGTGILSMIARLWWRERRRDPNPTSTHPTPTRNPPTGDFS
jgi:glycosyltransferase involved in cell wall biosynthesis